MDSSLDNMAAGDDAPNDDAPNDEVIAPDDPLATISSTPPGIGPAETHVSQRPNSADALPEQPRDVLELVARQVRLFAEAWKGDNVPAPADYLAESPPAVRRLLLVELLKVDLHRRGGRPELLRMVEDYLVQYPELADGHVPYDLLVEEYQDRRNRGEQVTIEEYERRFPQHAVELRRLLADADRAPSTALGLAVPMDELEAGQRIDDFDLLLRVGQGAFARVFLARQCSMQRLVALKISADRGNEPQTMAQLDHPNIVRVYDQRQLAGRDLRLLYMQYISGGTLQNVTERVRKVPAGERTGALLFAAIDHCLEARGEAAATDSPLRQRLSQRTWPEVVCWLGVRLASALDYAHQHNVLHRDLKPANVLVAADGSPKLADFNISFCSKVEGSTPAAYFGGSLPYMSPEQLEAFNPLDARTPADIDARSDIFSLGVVLWELLAGERPFHDPPAPGGWVMALDGMSARRREPLARRLPDDLPAGLAETLRRALSPERDDRFASAGQLMRQLEICLQPRAQRLLLPRGWRTWSQQHSLIAILIAGLAPNLIASLLSIAFNQATIIRHVPGAQEVFNLQIAVINPVAYAIAVGWLVRLAWPVLEGVLRRRRGQSEDPAHRAEQRRRCLRIGEYVAWVTAGAWTVCGIIFPVWLRLDDRAGGLSFDQYAVFFTDLVLCGLMAATLSFFCITFVNVRAFYPRLIDPDVNDPAAVPSIASLARRSGLYFLAAVSAPFIAVLAAGLLLQGNDRIAVLALAPIGLGTLFASFRLWREIQHDLDALAALLEPSASLGDGSSLMTDSSWSSMR